MKKQQTTNFTATVSSPVQPLQFDIKKEYSGNRTNTINSKEINRLIKKVISMRERKGVAHHRSKRVLPAFIASFGAYLRFRGVRGTIDDILLAYTLASGTVESFKFIWNYFGGREVKGRDIEAPFKETGKDISDFYDLFKGKDGRISTPYLEDITQGDLLKKLTENYWAIDKNREILSSLKDLILGNTGLLLANMGLLLVNTGLLIGSIFMLWNTNSKVDRNYDAILRLEGKVDRNYDAIRRVEDKVDRNLEAMLLRFNALEHNLDIKFKEIKDIVRESRIEGVTSELITFISFFIKERDDLRNLTIDQYITKHEEVNSVLRRLENSRVSQSGSLHTLLYNIMNQRFAILENANDKVALTALSLLCSGTETYISVMAFLLEEYSYLANLYYQKNDLEKYNQYFSLVLTTLNNFRSSLAGNDGLIDKVIDVLNEVKSYDFIKDEREDVVKFALKKISHFKSNKLKLLETNVSEEFLSLEKSVEKVKYDFSNSKIKTPIGSWEDRRTVSYAIQFKSNETSYQVGDWSSPARIHEKANPILNIGTDLKGRTRLIFRKFDNNNKPELVAIVEDSNLKEFRDVNRDLYNAALEPNGEIAISEIEVYLANGADIHAKYERGRQAIHAAAESGNSKVMVALINKGADINVSDTDGYAPIHVAAEIGHPNFIVDLINSGANVNAKTNLSKTALHIAAEKGYVKTVANLMQIEGIDINSKDQKGFTPLHIAASFGKRDVVALILQDSRIDFNVHTKVGFTPLHLATIGEYSGVVDILLKSNRVNINAVTESGLTALHFASLIGNLGIAKRIMRHYEIHMNKKSADSWTPLHLAIISRQENIALELLSIESTEINAKGKDDLTPLHLAASSGQKMIVSKLIDRKGVSIEDVDKYGYTPLHFAVESGDLDVVEYLAERGANLNAEKIDGYTPLGLAASNGESDIVQFLVNKKVNVSAENKNGMAPVYFAASKGHFSIVEFLTDKDANQGYTLHWAAYGGYLNIIRYLVEVKHFDLNKKDKYDNTPLHNAALQGHLNVVKYFIDEKQVSFNTQNKIGYTAFQFAIISGNFDTIKYFVDEKNATLRSSNENIVGSVLHLAVLNCNLGVIKYFIRKGIDVNVVDQFGNTPLFQASSRGQLDTVKYLVQKAANLKVRNNYGNTVLHFAVWNSHPEIVKYYIEEGLDLSTTNKNGDTPLHLASSVDIMKYLVEGGANARAVNNDGNTVLHIAVSNGNIEIVKYFIEEVADIDFQKQYVDALLELASQNGHTNIVSFLRGAQLKLDENIIIAFEEGKFDMVKEFISKGASLYTKDKNGNTILHLASSNGNLAIVKYLIEEVADINFQNKYVGASLELANRNGHTNIVKFLQVTQINVNLFTAVKEGKIDMVKEYVSKGASLYTKDKDGNTLLDLAVDNNDILVILQKARQLNLNFFKAVEQGDLELVKEYVLEVSLETKNKSGETPLYIAIQYDKLDVVKYLVEKGADLDAVNAYGWTALHLAAYKGRFIIVKFVIEKGANLNCINYDGNTPLDLAVANNHIRVKWFLEQTQLDLNLIDAVKEGNMDLVKEYASKGANLHVKDKSDKSLYDLTPSSNLVMINLLREISQLNYNLSTAVIKGNLDDVRKYIGKGASLEAKDSNNETPLHDAVNFKKMDVIKYLVEKGAYVDSSSNSGTTPLFIAVRHGDLPIIEYLVENAADANACNEDGYTPLHKAAEIGLLDIVKYFVGKGAGVNVSCKDGFTPLHAAVPSKKSFLTHLNVIKYLVEKGANTEAKNNHNKTPLDLAIESPNKNIAEFLQSVQVTSGASNPSSWINSLCGWIKEKGVMIASNTVYILYTVANKEWKNFKSGNAQTGFKQLVKPFNVTQLNIPHSQMSPALGTLKKKTYTSGTLGKEKVEESSTSGDTSGTEGSSNTTSTIKQVCAQPDIHGLMLIPTLISVMGRNINISFNSVDQPISPLKAERYAINIREIFEAVVQEAANDSEIAMHRLDIFFVKVQEEVTEKIMGGKFGEILGVLNSHVEKACPGNKAGYPGKLSPKKFYRFLTVVNSNLQEALHQPISLMLHPGNTLKVKESQKCLEIYHLKGLNNSVQGHLNQAESLRLSWFN